MQFGIIDNNGSIIEKTERRILAKEKDNLEEFIEKNIIKSVNELSNKYKITEVGIAMPGTSIEGVVLTSGNLGLKNYNLIRNLSKYIKIPIRIRNDAKCAGIAENKYGCLKEYKRSIFLTLGTGIGGAVFIDNKLLTAGNKPGYEFGHMVIQKDGIECNCGRKGCFERYASMKALKNNLRKALGLDETTRGQELLEMIRKNKNGNTNYDIIEKIVSEFIEYLSIGIVNLINIFEPQVIGIGGSFVYFEDVLLERLNKKVNEENLKRGGKEKIIIKTAVLGNDAGIIGSCEE